MTTKKESTKKTDTAPKPKKEKKILFEAVQENSTPKHVIVGALSLAGLLKQYRYEESVYGKEDIEPSITDDELEKIIKKFLG